MSEESFGRFWIWVFDPCLEFISAVCEVGTHFVAWSSDPAVAHAGLVCNGFSDGFLVGFLVFVIVAECVDFDSVEFDEFLEEESDAGTEKHLVFELLGDFPAFFLV